MMTSEVTDQDCQMGLRLVLLLIRPGELTGLAGSAGGTSCTVSPSAYPGILNRGSSISIGDAGTGAVAGATVLTTLPVETRGPHA